MAAVKERRETLVADLASSTDVSPEDVGRVLDGLGLSDDALDRLERSVGDQVAQELSADSMRVSFRTAAGTLAV
jgi:hypothetical protein